MKTEEPIIMYESDEAASIKTLTGWVSSRGRYWGKDEHMARYDGSTHKLCKCGKVCSKSYTICDSCRAESSTERYNKMPFREWDQASAVYDEIHDKYFFGVDDLEVFIDEWEGEDKPNLRLVHCEPNHPHEIDGSFWEDIFPEDSDGEIPDEDVAKALVELNKAIRNSKAWSYSPGKYRTEYVPEPPLTNSEK